MKECDACNRRPNSLGNGVKLCEDCAKLEELSGGDLGVVHDRLKEMGLASSQVGETNQ